MHWVIVSLIGLPTLFMALALLAALWGEHKKPTGRKTIHRVWKRERF